MTDSRTEQAARNNALWCDTLCRAHGAAGEFHAAAWLNRRPVPSFYPNLVTLASQGYADAQLAHIQDLIASGLPDHWAVKDSFSRLDLGTLGFQLLFEATWLWREPSVPAATGHDYEIQWVRLHDEVQLTKWETAWRGNPADPSTIQPPRLFLPSLLSDSDIAFLAASQGSEIVAGAIANRTGSVVGLSNVFTPPADNVAYWAGCVAAVSVFFPGMPLVGYESGPELALAAAAGFEKLQDLRVWVLQ